MDKPVKNKTALTASIDWKEKSVKRGREAKALNKRIRELKASRDLWKAKYMEAKSRRDMYENELSGIKKKLNDIMNL